MAGDWIKWVKGLTRKREVVRMAGSLKLSRREVASMWMEVWEWADENIPDEDIPHAGSAFVEMSPNDGDNMAFINTLVGNARFAQVADQVSWLHFSGGRIELPNFGRHNGETAKTRARNSKNKRRMRKASGHSEEENGCGSGANLSPPRGDILGTRARGEQPESPNASKGIGKASGNQRSIGPDAPMPKDARKRGKGKRSKAVFTDAQWDRAIVLAEAVARKIPPNNVAGRRCWFKYGMLAETEFGEGWLMDAVAGAMAKPSRESPQAHFVGILQDKAEEEHGIGEAAFDALMERIEVPSHLWHSGNLEIQA